VYLNNSQKEIKKKACYFVTLPKEEKSDKNSGFAHA
jgi:hypothetical protein